MARKYIEPTEAEEAAINRGIASDPDAREIPEEVIKRMRPFFEPMAQINDDAQWGAELDSTLPPPHRTALEEFLKDGNAHIHQPERSATLTPKEASD
ncbi:hypothetical protein OVY01_09560 [Robbsia sp. Bb-Pol-6]|uniref:Uncharacterized protein n=1 Tax=Robbsia betulipollinis TaxID=2981849 RepID=A0ABT3ZLY8_9BURK|nr:hypothetical protein [Robbsia betulipollinis]MCY0387477.1 hypothetical protein [Robbsia betulipollinis]